MENAEFIRYRILSYLKARSPHAVRDDELMTEFQREQCAVSAKELADEIVYLAGKGLITNEPKLSHGRTFYVQHLTALGRDVLDGNVPPPVGIVVL